MKQSDFIQMLLVAHSLPNRYCSKFPQNLGYYNGKNYSFDCWNMIKVIVSGWQPTGVVGSYFPTNKLVTGDVTGEGLLKQCHDRSRDFSKISVAGTYLYGCYDDKKKKMHPHAGVYLGEFDYLGKTYNVVECTTSWGGGVIFSYVDAKGIRRKFKGSNSTGYRWTDYGLLNCIEYNENEQFILYGCDYSPVFDPKYYREHQQDVANSPYGKNDQTLWQHFCIFGMNEFRRASEEFDPYYYKWNNKDVADCCGDNNLMYYYHYVKYGKAEGRKGKE